MRMPSHCLTLRVYVRGGADESRLRAKEDDGLLVAHIGMHVHNAPDDLQGLIYIDELFHVPLMSTVAVLAYCFVGDRDVRSENV